jgi:hypothetical protein
MSGTANSRFQGMLTSRLNSFTTNLHNQVILRLILEIILNHIWSYLMRRNDSQNAQKKLKEGKSSRAEDDQKKWDVGERSKFRSVFFCVRSKFPPFQMIKGEVKDPSVLCWGRAQNTDCFILARRLINKSVVDAC